MTTLEALYLQDPFWIWLGLASVFVALSFATGVNLLLLPSACAVAVALLEVAGVRLGLTAETGVFAALTAFALMGAFALQPRARVAVVGATAARQARASGYDMGSGKPTEDPSALVGRIARATGEFNNGVGRVWIDGSEWAAEIDGIEETLPLGASVRVIRVIGGVKLQVRGLEA
jgi:membrane protein implicated in regulation of membrane protease activity